MRAYVGVGANLGDAEATVRAAMRDLASLGRVRASSLYRTEPLGDPGDPWYVNAVAELETELEPHALLGRLRALETAAGRPAERRRWAPRELDLDLLLYGDRRIKTPDLTVPHPEMTRRRFVLEPLCELAADLRHPTAEKTIAELLRVVDDPLGIEKL